MRGERDCIEQVAPRAERDGRGEEALKAIDAEVKARVSEAAEFAQASPEPDASELWTDILVEG